jgi:hypothetical protein
VTFEEAIWSVETACGLSAHGRQTQTKEENMKKNLDNNSEQEKVSEAEEPEMLAHYSFKGGQRGRYTHLFPQKPHLVVLSPDMAAVFPDSDSVNEALRTLVKAVQGNMPANTEREAA